MSTRVDTRLDFGRPVSAVAAHGPTLLLCHKEQEAIVGSSQISISYRIVSPIGAAVDIDELLVPIALLRVTACSPPASNVAERHLQGHRWCTLDLTAGRRRHQKRTQS